MVPVSVSAVIVLAIIGLFSAANAEFGRFECGGLDPVRMHAVLSLGQYLTLSISLKTPYPKRLNFVLLQNQVVMSEWTGPVGGSHYAVSNLSRCSARLIGADSEEATTQFCVQAWTDDDVAVTYLYAARLYSDILFTCPDGDLGFEPFRVNVARVLESGYKLENRETLQMIAPKPGLLPLGKESAIIVEPARPAHTIGVLVNGAFWGNLGFTQNVHSKSTPEVSDVFLISSDFFEHAAPLGEKSVPRSITLQAFEYQFDARSYHLGTELVTGLSQPVVVKLEEDEIPQVEKALWVTSNATPRSQNDFMSLPLLLAHYSLIAATIQLHPGTPFSFVHIPRTGGGSLSDWLSDVAEAKGLKVLPRDIITGGPRPADVMDGGHVDATGYDVALLHADFEAPLFSDHSHLPLVVTVLRDPIVRFESVFRHFEHFVNPFTDPNNTKLPKTADQLAKLVLAEYDEHRRVDYGPVRIPVLRNEMTWALCGVHCDSSSTPLSVALRRAQLNLAKIHFVGITEKLPSLMQRLEARVPWITSSQRHMNKRVNYRPRTDLNTLSPAVKAQLEKVLWADRILFHDAERRDAMDSLHG